MKKNKAIKVAFYGVFVALAFIFSYVEVLIPIPLGIPGVKLGLANIVVLTALYAFGWKEAFVISCIRIILVGFTFGNLSSLLFSLAGGLLSWLVMTICKKIKVFSMLGVSIAGGISHNVGQIAVASILLKTESLLYYLCVLVIVGTITGLLIGVLAGYLLKIPTQLND